MAATKGLAKNDGDVLIYALYPTTGARFLKWKYGLEPVPDEVKPKTLEQVKLEDTVYTTIKKQKLFAKVKEYLDSLEKTAPAKGAGLRTFNVFVDGQYYEVEVECTSGAPVLTAVAPAAASAGFQPVAAAPKPAAAPAPAAAPRPAAPAACRSACRRTGRRRSAAPSPHARHDHQLQRQGGG